MPRKKYGWLEVDGTKPHGPFRTIKAATADAQENAGSKEVRLVEIYASGRWYEIGTAKMDGEPVR